VDTRSPSFLLWPRTDLETLHYHPPMSQRKGGSANLCQACTCFWRGKKSRRKCHEFERRLRPYSIKRASKRVKFDRKPQKRKCQGYNYEEPNIHDGCRRNASNKFFPTTCAMWRMSIPRTAAVRVKDPTMYILCVFVSIQILLCSARTAPVLVIFLGVF